MKCFALIISMVLACTQLYPQTNQECWVKVLNYHEILPAEDIKDSNYLRLDDKKKASRAVYLIVPVDKFEEQLQFLKASYTVMSLRSMLWHIDNKEPFNSNGAVITIDGAGEDIYTHVYPLLKKYDMPATIFIQTRALKDPGGLTWEHMKEMSDNGIEIGSHSVNHIRLTKRYKKETQEIYEQRITNELADSKLLLESKLKKKVEYFAYPYGAYNETVERLVLKAGYKAAVTVQWDKNTLSSNSFRLKRRPVKGTMSLSEFVNIFKYNAQDDFHESTD